MRGQAQGVRRLPDDGDVGDAECYVHAAVSRAQQVGIAAGHGIAGRATDGHQLELGAVAELDVPVEQTVGVEAARLDAEAVAAKRLLRAIQVAYRDDRMIERGGSRRFTRCGQRAADKACRSGERDQQHGACGTSSGWPTRTGPRRWPGVRSEERRHVVTSRREGFHRPAARQSTRTPDRPERGSPCPEESFPSGGRACRTAGTRRTVPGP